MVAAIKLDTSWMARAECRIRGISPHVFYVDDEYGKPPDVCGMCIVREDCLEYALANREREGFWGGTNQAQRRSIIRARRNRRNAERASQNVI